MTKTTHKPTLSRVALLALVEWTLKNKNRSAYIELHGMGTATTGTSISIDQSPWEIGVEETKKNDDRGSYS